tara:strand:+ start:168 stop:317 length:150 start_codon:yes stop_codon:yes gene_type:complete
LGELGLNKEKYMFSKPKYKNEAGKGDLPRFYADKEYKENYDKIFRKKKS